MYTEYLRGWWRRQRNLMNFPCCNRQWMLIGCIASPQRLDQCCRRLSPSYHMLLALLLLHFQCKTTAQYSLHHKWHEQFVVTNMQLDFFVPIKKMEWFWFLYRCITANGVCYRQKHCEHSTGKCERYLRRVAQKTIFQAVHRTMRSLSLATFQEPCHHSQPCTELSTYWNGFKWLKWSVRAHLQCWECLWEIQSKYIFCELCIWIHTTPHQSAWAKLLNFLFTSFSIRYTANDANISPKNPMYNVVINSCNEMNPKWKTMGWDSVHSVWSKNFYKTNVRIPNILCIHGWINPTLLC